MRIVILGTCGAGKTTLAKKLSKQLGIPHVEIDSLYWKPNWQATDEETFKQNVQAKLEAENWIVDGNYSITRDLIWSKADLAIWLDYPFNIHLRHLLKRTVRNIQTQRELFPGCRESFRQQFFSKDSIFLFLVRKHGERRRKYPRLFQEFPHLKVKRIRHPKELADLEV